MFEMQELMVTIPAAETAGRSPAAKRPPADTDPDLAGAVTPDEPCDYSGCDDSGCADSGCWGLSTCQLADSCPGGSSCDLEGSVCIGETSCDAGSICDTPPSTCPGNSTCDADSGCPDLSSICPPPSGDCQPGGPTICPPPDSICAPPHSRCPTLSTCTDDTRCETVSACGPTLSVCQAPSGCEAPSACEAPSSTCESPSSACEVTLEAVPPDQEDRNAERPDAAFDLDELKASLMRRLTSASLAYQQTGPASDRRD